MSTPNRAGRAEGVVQMLILLAIGGMAAAASFTHVHDLTVKHGQPSWIGWANAVALELMSIAVGLEIRRRLRTVGKPGGFLIGVLVGAAGLSLSAQVADAQRSVWGWIVAALPAAAFLVLVKVVLSRSTHTTQDTNTTTEPAPVPVVDPTTTTVPMATVARTEVHEEPAPVTTPEPKPEPESADVPDPDTTPAADRPVFAPWAPQAATPPTHLNGHTPAGVSV